VEEQPFRAIPVYLRKIEIVWPLIDQRRKRGKNLAQGGTKWNPGNVEILASAPEGRHRICFTFSWKE
jgi:hypothetical protein